MSKIRGILDGNMTRYEDDRFTEEQRSFLLEEGFTCSEHLDYNWIFEERRGEHTVRVYAYESGRFDLYIERGETTGDFESEETFFISDSDFDDQYEKMLSAIQLFFGEGVNDNDFD